MILNTHWTLERWRKTIIPAQTPNSMGRNACAEYYKRLFLSSTLLHLGLAAAHLTCYQHILSKFHRRAHATSLAACLQEQWIFCGISRALFLSTILLTVNSLLSRPGTRPRRFASGRHSTVGPQRSASSPLCVGPWHAMAPLNKKHSIARMLDSDLIKNKTQNVEYTCNHVGRWPPWGWRAGCFCTTLRNKAAESVSSSSHTQL